MNRENPVYTYEEKRAKLVKKTMDMAFLGLAVVVKDEKVRKEVQAAIKEAWMAPGEEYEDSNDQDIVNSLPWVTKCRPEVIENKHPITETTSDEEAWNNIARRSPIAYEGTSSSSSSSSEMDDKTNNSFVHQLQSLYTRPNSMAGPSQARQSQDNVASTLQGSRENYVLHKSNWPNIIQHAKVLKKAKRFARTLLKRMNHE